MTCLLTYLKVRQRQYSLHCDQG